jgi:hypothetical protein
MLKSIFRATHRQKVVLEFAKEHVDPLFSEENDTLFFIKYLATKARNHFKEDLLEPVQGPFDVTEGRKELFTDCGIIDDRVAFKSGIIYNRNNADMYALTGSFIPALEKVFTGPLAVSAQQGLKNDIRHFEIRGNPSRLVRDIIINDPKTAALVAQEMGLEIPQNTSSFAPAEELDVALK